MHVRRLHDFDIVMFYADLGKPYLSLIQRMSDSVRAQMPGARLLMLTPTPKKKFVPYFDGIMDLSDNMAATDKNVCYEKVRAIVSWQRITKRNTIYVDPDLEFLKPAEFGDFDVGLLWRTKKKPDQPINTGFIMTKPGPSQFWDKYAAICANLPIGLRAWWCDQLGFSVLLGALHSPGETLQALDAKVHLMDMNDTCTSPEFANDKTIALHYKGAENKAEILQFPIKNGAQ